MNRPHERRSDPNHPHNHMLDRRKERRLRRTRARQSATPWLFGRWQDETGDVFGDDRAIPPRRETCPEEEACERAKDEMYSADNDRWYVN